MLIRKKIKVSNFDLGLRFVVTDDFDAACKALLKHEGLEDLHTEAALGLAGYQMVKDTAVFYCVITLDESLILKLKTLVHELHHINQDILEYNGVHFKKKDPNEVYAHTYEFLFGEAYVVTVNAWNKKYKKVKNDKNRTTK